MEALRSPSFIGKIPLRLKYVDENGKFLALKQNSLIYLFGKHKIPFLSHIKKMFRNKEFDFNKFFTDCSLRYQDDITIINKLRKIRDRKGFNREERAENRANSIKVFLDTDFSDIKEGKKYLDLGGGDGSISNSIGKYLGLEKDFVISADLENTFSIEEYRNYQNVNYITLDKEMSVLPFQDEEFFLVTCFMVLHHIRNVEAIIKELNRILVKGGYILIREHDAQTINDKILIDAEHRLYDLALDDVYDTNKIKYTNVEGFNIEEGYLNEGMYRPKEVWTNIFKNYGFERILVNFKSIPYKFNNTKYYYSVYKKK